MLRFLFGGRKEEEAKVETQRETFTRLVTELNELMDGMAEKPKVTIDPNDGSLAFDLPETMPDEALALPAPEEPKAEKPEEEAASEEPSAEAEAGETEAAPKAA